MNIHIVQDSDWSNFFDIYDAATLERYWVLESQAGWAIHNFDYDFDRADEAYEKNCLGIEGDQSPTLIVDKGKIPYALDLFTLDEWTYLIGFKANDSEWPKIAELAYSHVNEPDKLFEKAPNSDIIWICHIDGWWEVWSESENLPGCVHQNLKNIKIEKSGIFSPKGNEKEYNDQVAKVNS